MTEGSNHRLNNCLQYIYLSTVAAAHLIHLICDIGLFGSLLQVCKKSVCNHAKQPVENSDSIQV